MKFLFILLLCGLFHSGHHCRWKKCPYKGIKKSEWSKKVTEYTGCERGEDGHIADMVHLLKPKWSYDKIAEAVFND